MRPRSLFELSLCLATATTLWVATTSSAAAAGDVAAGVRTFKATCGICHMANANPSPNDAAMRIGPNLFGVVGRPAGTVKGFRYSQAMKNSGKVWTEDNLRLYIHQPQKIVPNIRMTFRGLQSQTDVENVLAYLKTLKK